MEPINEAVATNLKTIREQRKLSLDGLAKMTGVSKSMLAQIEHGEANPTITTVWKIANGLKVPFTELVTRPEKDYETIDIKEVAVLVEDAGRYRNYPVFPYDDTRKFEIYYIELDPGCRLQAAPHPEGTHEFLMIFTGEVAIEVNGETLYGDENHAVRFKADLPHAYKNAGTETCKLNMVISYTDV